MLLARAETALGQPERAAAALEAAASGNPRLLPRWPSSTSGSSDGPTRRTTYERLVGGGPGKPRRQNPLGDGALAAGRQ